MKILHLCGMSKSIKQVLSIIKYIIILPITLPYMYVKIWVELIKKSYKNDFHSSPKEVILGFTMWLIFISIFVAVMWWGIK